MFEVGYFPPGGGKNLPLFCFLENYPHISAWKKLPLTFFVHPRRRKNMVGVLFSSFAVKNEDNIRHRRGEACRTSIRMMHGD